MSAFLSHTVTDAPKTYAKLTPQERLAKFLKRIALRTAAKFAKRPRPLQLTKKLAIALKIPQEVILCADGTVIRADNEQIIGSIPEHQS